MKPESNIVDLAMVKNHIGLRAKQLNKAKELWQLGVSSSANGLARLRHLEDICRILQNNNARLCDIGANPKAFQQTVWLAMLHKIIDENEHLALCDEDVQMLVNIVDHRFRENEMWPALNHRDLGLTTELVTTYFNANLRL